MEVQIFFSCSAPYLRYVLIALWSAILAKAPHTRYTVFVFCRAIGSKEQDLLHAMALHCPKNVQIIFQDTEEAIRCRKLPVEIQAGQETALCLLAADLLPSVGKVLALDGDLIIKRDLQRLFAVPLGEAVIAGAKDYDFIGRYNSQTPLYRKEYVERLSLGEPFSYLQGGVLLLDLRKIRILYPNGLLFQEFCKEHYQYDEQDFLNWKFESKRKLLDARWNVLHDNCRHRSRYVIQLCPRQCVQEYLESRENPWIIHYAGTDKPWKNDQCDFAKDFWRVVDVMPPPLRIDRPVSPQINAIKHILKTTKLEMLRAWQMRHRLKR